jgi:ribonuclease HII
MSPSIEEILFSSGVSQVAGVDEAGRGACAGPLVVAAVILRDPFAPELYLVRDSKELSERDREGLFDVIVENSLAVSVIEISSSEIDERGVHLANIEGMRRAVLGLQLIPQYVLTDGYAIPGVGIPNLGVWKGDQVVHSISAASIIAKVSRDRIMRALGKVHPQYGFASHKGYSTAAHLQAIQDFGLLDGHRRSFSNISAFINS